TGKGSAQDRNTAIKNRTCSCSVNFQCSPDHRTAEVENSAFRARPIPVSQPEAIAGLEPAPLFLRMRPGFGSLSLMRAEHNARGESAVRAFAEFDSDGTKLLCHPNVVHIAKDVLQRLQLLHERLDILAREDRREELDHIAQLLQGAAHLVLFFRFKVLDCATAFCDFLPAPFE